MQQLDKINSKADEAGIETVKPQVDENLPEVLRTYSPDDLQALEKALVRKIDMRSLPILIILFLLNILDRNAIANARLGGLEDSLNISDVQYQTAVMVLWGECSFYELEVNSIDDYGSRLYHHDGAFQHDAVALPTQILPSYGRHHLGRRLWGHWLCSELPRPCCPSFPRRCYRSALLPWLHLLPFLLVHEERAPIQDCHLLHGLHSRLSFWRFDRCWYHQWHGRRRRS